jgi:hypothetical protein
MKETPFVLVVNGSVEQQRDGFEAGVRVSAADLPRAHDEVIVHQRDDGIGRREVVHRDNGCGEVPGAGKPRLERRDVDDAREPSGDGHEALLV